MRKRMLDLVGVASVIAAVSLALTPVAGQGQATAAKAGAAKAGVALQTAWGEAELERLWSDEYQIPLQRPEKYAGKELFTDAEVAALDRERATKPSFGEKRAE